MSSIGKAPTGRRIGRAWRAAGLGVAAVALGMATVACGSSTPSSSPASTTAPTATTTPTATTASPQPPGEPPLPNLDAPGKSDTTNSTQTLADQTVVAKYAVTNGNLSSLVSGTDDPKYRAIWNFYTQLMPPNDRQSIGVFAMYVPKGESQGTAGYVTLNDTKSAWILAVDPQSPGGEWDLADTLIHETMHTLSLGGQQVDAAVPAEQCDSFPAPQGCPRPGSYLASFVTKYWVSIIPQWVEAQKAGPSGIEAFYNTYKNDFTRAYAATSPVEDIAESFAAFVMNTPGVPSGVTQKEQFFDAYSPLVAIKTYAQSHGLKGLQPPAAATSAG